MGSVLDDVIRDARHRLRAIHEDLEAPAIRRLDAAKSGRSLASKIMRCSLGSPTTNGRNSSFGTQAAWYRAGPRKKRPGSRRGKFRTFAARHPLPLPSWPGGAPPEAFPLSLSGHAGIRLRFRVVFGSSGEFAAR